MRFKFNEAVNKFQESDWLGDLKVKSCRFQWVPRKLLRVFHEDFRSVSMRFRTASGCSERLSESSRSFKGFHRGSEAVSGCFNGGLRGISEGVRGFKKTEDSGGFQEASIKGYLRGSWEFLETSQVF